MCVQEYSFLLVLSIESVIKIWRENVLGVEENPFLINLDCYLFADSSLVIVNSECRTLFTGIFSNLNKYVERINFSKA